VQIELTQAVLKRQAKILREHLKRHGKEVSHSQSLEAASAMHGFRNWQTARALVPESDLPENPMLQTQERTDTLMDGVIAAQTHMRRTARHHSLTDNTRATPEVQRRRAELFPWFLSGRRIGQFLEKELATFAATGASIPRHAEQWAKAVGDLDYFYAFAADPDECARLNLENIAECGDPKKMLARYNAVADVLESKYFDTHLRNALAFFNRFQGAGETALDFFNPLQRFARWLDQQFGIEQHAGRIEHALDE
jgi:hypothetical protein